MTVLTRSIAASGPIQRAVQTRKATSADTTAVARIMYEAFRRFHESRGSAPDFPDLETATAIASGQIDDPASYGVIAEYDGRIVGSNFLTEGDPIRGVGPISVHPDFQDSGVGRLLMQAVLERSAAARGVRLLQDAFNTKSMALYASLGFRVREPAVVMTGRLNDRSSAGTRVRPMTPTDLAAADSLAKRVLGNARGTELRTALGRGTPVVLERGGRIVAYMTMPHLWLLNHAVAETQADLMALILGIGAESAEPIGFLAPIRQAEFFRWCLDRGLQIVKPMTLMTRGEYSEPLGAWIPSVLY